MRFRERVRKLPAFTTRPASTMIRVPFFRFRLDTTWRDAWTPLPCEAGGRASTQEDEAFEVASELAYGLVKKAYRL